MQLLTASLLNCRVTTFVAAREDPKNNCKIYVHGQAPEAVKYDKGVSLTDLDKHLVSTAA